MTVLRVNFNDGQWWEVDSDSHHIIGASAGLGAVWASGKIAVDPATLVVGKKPKYFTNGPASSYLFGQLIAALKPAADIAGATPLEMAARS